MHEALSRAIIDPECPWKLSRGRSEFPPYPFKKSESEWKALLARAEQGDPEAEFEVASYYDDGCKDRAGQILVKRSKRQTLRWLQRAAAHGHASAQNNLGVLLGRRDSGQAMAWLRRASRAGDACAAHNLAVTSRDNGNLKRAVYWFRRAAAAGDDSALLQLGIHYYWGKGIRGDRVAAVRCYRQAAKGRNISDADRDDAYFYLAITYLEGKGVRRSFAIARKLLRRADIDHDHRPAFQVLQDLGEQWERRAPGQS
jgi:hypothetical protein